MRLAAGSAPWLLRHELRLAWRTARGRRLWLWIAIGAALWLTLHVGVWLLLRGFSGRVALPRVVFAWLGLATWFTLTLMLAQAIQHSVSAFFERGDLDLLLASPLPPRHVLVVRALGVAVSTTAIYAWLLTPFAHVGVIVGQPRLIAIYPALAAFGLLAAAAGMALTLTLVHAFCARRARTLGQWIGGLVGAGFFLVVQFGNVVAPERAARWRATIANPSLFPDRDSAIWLPLRAMLGEPLALAAVAAAALIAFASVIPRMTRHFVAGAAESAAAPVPELATASAAAPRFRAGVWRNVLVKEWKLVVRDPLLVGHTLLQSIYVLPLALVWMRDGSPRVALAPVVVMLCATLASGLAWLTVAAEDAPELLASAPVERSRLRLAKLVAALVPVWLVALPLALVLAASSAAAAAIFALCVVGGSTAAGSIHLALPRPGRRRDVRRRATGNALVTVFELLATLAWSALTWCLLAAPLFALLPAVPAFGAPLAAWWLGRRDRRDSTAA